MLHGENFNLLPPGELGITFGGSAGVNIQRVSDTLITVVTPLHAEGSTMVRMTMNGVTIPRYGRRTYTFSEDVPPSSSTSSTTTTSTTTTTTSTLQCSTCDDGDPCTLDYCITGGCGHHQADNLIDVVDDTGDCVWQFVPVRIGDRFVQACQLVTQGKAEEIPIIKRRLFKAAVSVFTRALRATQAAGSRLDSGINLTCATTLETLLEDARTEARRLSEEAVPTN